MIKKLLSLTIIKIFVIFQLLTRLTLCLYGLWHQQIAATELPAILLVGVFNDFVAISYFVPLILILTIISYRFLAKYHRSYRVISFIGYLAVIWLLIFNLIAEIIFWDEFGTKFNFIAVDYLIYTREIIGTLNESLPLAQILAAMIIIALVITGLIVKYYTNRQPVTIRNQWLNITGLLLLSIIAWHYYDSQKVTFNTNRYAQELAKNGPLEFFAAFYNNILNYHQLYPTIPSQRALEILRSRITDGGQQFLTAGSINRRINNPLLKTSRPKQQYNVVVIVVESLSSEFIGAFGNQQNITPYLDQLASQSIFFRNVYAAGTRTVRGLEAITLSVPPTPGAAIIRRPNNQNLFNLSTVFNQQGYKSYFIFGGYSYFDNLQNYFSSNGYQVIDRGDLKPNEITFANIWGVADEDIFSKSLKVIDQDNQNDQAFFAVIMTTSNHRPYTFPAGRIDLPSGQGRQAAVKYTDYAVGQFIEQAKKYRWFDETIFIITADHCASSAGKTDLPVHKYHIPLMIYAPKLLKPQIIDQLASQIDIAPTILGILGTEYESKFFGQDILNFPAQRAFIGTYQLLGYIKDQHLIVLAPNCQPKTYQLIGSKQLKVVNSPPLVEEAISFYQTAYEFYITGKMANTK